jgi:hypothetical protein
MFHLNLFPLITSIQNYFLFHDRCFANFLLKCFNSFFSLESFVFNLLIDRKFVKILALIDNRLKVSLKIDIFFLFCFKTSYFMLFL